MPLIIVEASNDLFAAREQSKFARDKYLMCVLFVPGSRRALPGGNDSRERHHGYAKFM
jgi:hypothetical protein